MLTKLLSSTFQEKHTIKHLKLKRIFVEKTELVKVGFGRHVLIIFHKYCHTNVFVLIANSIAKLLQLIIYPNLK